MKLRETVKIGEKEITIKELTIKELLYICYKTGLVKDVPEIDFEKQFPKEKSMSLVDVILSFSSDVSKTDIIAFAPSELQTLYNIFMRMNEVTLSVAQYFGVYKVIDDVKTDVIRSVMTNYENFMSVETDTEVSNGDGIVKK